VVLSGQASTDEAARAIRMGADQILIKPVELVELHTVLLRLLSGERPQRRSSSPKHKSECLNPFVGTSAAIQRLREIASRVLAGESPILIQGDTGSGKGVLANWIHRNGPRAPTLPRPELRRTVARTPGIRTVRLREGSVHQRGCRQTGAAGGGKPRHRFLG